MERVVTLICTKLVSLHFFCFPALLFFGCWAVSSSGTVRDNERFKTLAGLVEAFDTNYIVGVREEPRLTEQQFGNFQNLATIVNSKAERARFGRFYYR